MTTTASKRVESIWTPMVGDQPASHLAQPLAWRNSRRVYVQTAGGLFHPDVPDTVVAHVFAVMIAAPHHTYLIQSGWYERAARLLGEPAFIYEVSDLATGRYKAAGEFPWPLPHVWLCAPLPSLTDAAHAGEDVA
jgi:protein gp37